MFASDDMGRRLDAEYSVEQDGNLLALVLESASGNAPSRPARNTDYRRALTVLLGRLRGFEAVLKDGLVDSALTKRRGIPESDRRLFQAPIRLADEPDMELLRRRLTSAQGSIAQAPEASKGGNSTKRIRLRLVVPGFAPDDADRLAVALSAATPDDQPYRSPEESPPGKPFAEGAVTQVTVNKYERDPRARRACLDHFGYRCSVCDLDFEERYGELGRGFIHVHHLKELSAVGPDYRVDPREDLRPVCPNCHAMLHKVSPAMPVEELRRRLRIPRSPPTPSPT
ncbi:MAG TPA: HNH endonuclease [Streptosporangiaceae bacterium]|nr:HNH endonuclease [Streptosporangiaceae bacterium]